VNSVLQEKTSSRRHYRVSRTSKRLPLTGPAKKDIRTNSERTTHEVQRPHVFGAGIAAAQVIHRPITRNLSTRTRRKNRHV
jgi:hypothetical protein